MPELKPGLASPPPAAHFVVLRPMWNGPGASTPRCSAARPCTQALPRTSRWLTAGSSSTPAAGRPTTSQPSPSETPPDLDRASSFLNIRVSDIAAAYADWTARGAQFLTPPKQHDSEIRCYLRDPSTAT